MHLHPQCAGGNTEHQRVETALEQQDADLGCVEKTSTPVRIPRTMEEWKRWPAERYPGCDIGKCHLRMFAKQKTCHVHQLCACSCPDIVCRSFATHRHWTDGGCSNNMYVEKCMQPHDPMHFCHQKIATEQLLFVPCDFQCQLSQQPCIVLLADYVVFLRQLEVNSLRFALSWAY